MSIFLSKSLNGFRVSSPTQISNPQDRGCDPKRRKDQVIYVSTNFSSRNLSTKRYGGNKDTSLFLVVSSLDTVTEVTETKDRWVSLGLIEFHDIPSLPQ